MPWYDQAGRLKDPVPEVLDRWLSIADLRIALGGGIPPTLVQALYDRLLTRELEAAARNARFDKRGVQIPHPYTAIDPSWWRNVEGGMTLSHPFWQTGDVKIVVPARGGDPNTSVLFCDVRFEPGGLRGLVPSTARGAVKAQPQRVAQIERPTDPTAQDFLTWIRPAEALVYLQPVGIQTAAEEIYRRLKGGLLLGAGSVGRVPKLLRDEDPRGVVPHGWWDFAPEIAKADAPFWLTGGVSLTVQTDRGAGVEFVTHEHFAVRFDPEGFQRLADDLGVAVLVSPKKRQRMALVHALSGFGEPQIASPTLRARPESRPQQPPDSVLRKWLEKHERQFPGQVHHLLKAAFDASNPSFAAGKRQLYRVMKQVRGALRAGNPSISRASGGK